jgi:2-amino-4-hydroxy-6-hydroxymethyldihydropteridine diphosphokinase
MLKYVIIIGSSDLHGIAYLNRSKNELDNNTNLSVHGESRIYKNSSAGTHSNSLFYNCALAISTFWHPCVFYRELNNIEHLLGRIRTYRNARRTIDIDVLMSLDFTYKTAKFFLPHPSVWERNFFVIPAAEALKSAGWPVPFLISTAALRFGKQYLCP